MNMVSKLPGGFIDGSKNLDREAMCEAIIVK